MISCVCGLNVFSIHCVSDISTDVLHIPDLILKLYVFISFLYELFPIRQETMVLGLPRTTERTTKYHFLIICRNLKFIKEIRG